MQKFSSISGAAGSRPFTANMQNRAESGGYTLIDAQGFLARVQDGSVFVVDVRDAHKFEEGHVAGAMCFPMPPTWMARFFKRWWLKRLLCTTSCKAVVFY